MTNKEGKAFAEWNKKTTKAVEEGRDKSFKRLQELTNKYNFPTYCRASVNFCQLIKSDIVSEEDKEIAMLVYNNYVLLCTRENCLSELINVLGWDGKKSAKFL